LSVGPAGPPTFSQFFTNNRCAEAPSMPNDAKLGLVLGIALVIALGVVFFRKETPTDAPTAMGGPAAVTPVRAPAARSQFRAAPAKVMSHTEPAHADDAPARPDSESEAP
jgi:hypothetical protein